MGNTETYDNAWKKACEVEFDTRLFRAAASTYMDNGEHSIYVLRVMPQWPKEIYQRLNPDQIHQIDGLFYMRALARFHYFSLKRRDLAIQTYKLADGSMVFAAKEKDFDPASAKKLDVDDWHNPLKEWVKATTCGNPLANDVIDGLITHVFSFSSLSEMSKSVRAMNPGGFIGESGARAVLYGCMQWSKYHDNEPPMPYGENHKEIKQAEQWLERRGIKQLRLLGAGNFSTVFDTNGEYVVRIDNKRERELAEPLPPQMLKSAFSFETEHYRVRIMPRLRQHATQEDFEDTKQTLALQGYDFFDQKGKKYNIGLLPDGTPLVYDLGAVRKDSGAAEFIDPSYVPKHTWVVDGKDKQAHFFPWVSDNSADKEQRFRDYIKGYHVATKPFDEWFKEAQGKNYVQHRHEQMASAIELDAHGHAVSGTMIEPSEQKILEEMAMDKTFQQQAVTAPWQTTVGWKRVIRPVSVGNVSGRA